MRLTVTVPATVANLGPGFDSLALAVEIRNEFAVDTSAPPGVAVEGEGAAELPEDGSNLVVRAMRAVAEAAGRDLPPFSVTARNRIPLTRGLGSSASAVVGGLSLANRVLGANLDREGLLDLAVRFEGHADNVAASLHGGLTIAYETAAGWAAARVEGPLKANPVLFVPEAATMATDEARRILPAEVPLRDASANAGRVALLVVALTDQPDLLWDAMADRLHQGRRLETMPATRAAFVALRDAGIPVCLAGSGPSLLAFDTGERAIPDVGAGWRVVRPAIADEGVAVLEG
jgi:homoserine kinase